LLPALATDEPILVVVGFPVAALFATLRMSPVF
jgi:hypothetical protein